MRLLSIDEAGNLSLTKELYDEDIPQYAIISHTWGKDEDEVTLRDLTNGTGIDKPGYQKIRLCGKQATRDELQYFWVDSCCIDRSNSSELSEAIKSMYSWYSKAAKCYAYLSDVSQTAPQYDTKPDPEILEQTLRQSSWFTRGWTLQELIAPRIVQFYDADWHCLGDKKSLSTVISQATRISTDVLEGRKHPRDFAIAQRMSWASNRRTRRIEDLAYSLMGIFDVKMPMVYGESDRAFLRLQEEIIKSSDDQSIFAWQTNTVEHTGLLASNANAFAASGNIRKGPGYSGLKSYTMGTGGLVLEADMVAYTMDTYLVTLACVRVSANLPRTHDRVGIFLRKLKGGNQYGRVAVDGKHLIDATILLQAPLRTSIHVPQIPITANDAEFLRDRTYGFRLSESLLSNVNTENWPYRPLVRFDLSNRIVTVDHCTTSGWICTLNLANRDTKICKVKIGFDVDFNPVIVLAESSALRSAQSFLDMKYWTSGTRYTDPNMCRGFDEVHADIQVYFNDYINVNNNTLILAHEWRPALWVVKASSSNGSKVHLQDAEKLNIGGTCVRLTRGDLDGLLVWDLDIKFCSNKGGLKKIWNKTKGT